MAIARREPTAVRSVAPRAAERRAAARPAGAGASSRRVARRRSLLLRRVRAVALLVVLLAMVGMGIVGLGGWSAAADVTPPSATVVLQPGQTIWDLAGAHAPEGSSRAAYAHAITTANDVDPLRVAPGTELVLP